MERQTHTKNRVAAKSASHIQRQSGPSRSARNALRDFHTSLGNQAVQRLMSSGYIQTKLQVSTPEDASEQEADQVADEVMRMEEPEPKVQMKPIGPQIVAPKSKHQHAVTVAVREDDDDEEKVQTKRHPGSPQVQRLCTECEEEKEQAEAQSPAMVQQKSAPEKLPVDDEEEQQVQPKGISIQRLCAGCEDEQAQLKPLGDRAGWTGTAGNGSNFVQCAADGSFRGASSTPRRDSAFSKARSIPDYAARAVAGRGGPLPYAKVIQTSFGRHDISNIEAHVGGAAGQAALNIGARAYATGTHVAFNASPDLHTAAHEAAHVVQQRGGVQLAGGVGRSGDKYERHADAVADRVVRGESAEGLLDQMAGDTQSASGEVVQRDDNTISAMTMPELVDMLGMPAETVPSGAETNPDFLKALVDARPGASVSQLEEVLGVPEDVVANLPEGQLSNVTDEQLLGFVSGERKADPSMGPAHGVVPGATHGAMESLVHRGYQAAGPNAIGIVAFPQSRVVRGAFTGKLGTGPMFPESRILFGHTAVYVRVDGAIKVIKSFAPESLIDATLNIRQVSSGTGPGVAARIVDHLGEPFPPGGKMFDITSGRSIEYAVPKEVATRFIDKLPQGGPMPGSFYTAQPHLANQLGGNTRMCASRNCVHWAVDEIEKALGTKIGPGGTSLVDQPKINAARQSATSDFMKGPGGEKVKLGTGETVTPARGEMPTSMKVLKWGNRVFMVYAVYHGVERLIDSPMEEKLIVLGEELGLFVGGHYGAQAGVAGCGLLGISTAGIGFLVCGIAGAYGGSWVGEKVGGFLGRVITAPILAPIIGMQLTVMLLGGFMEGAEELGKILGLPFRAIAAGLVSNRERLNVDNWDLRYFPADMAADVRMVGSAVWRELGSLKADDLLGRIMNPLSTYAIPADAVARIAAGVTRMQQKSGAGAKTAAEILAMNPIDFIRMLEIWKLTFVQDPDYVGGFFTGRWEDEQSLVVHLGPLIRERAEINPWNWDVSQVPVVEFEDVDEPIDLGDAITAVGGYVWSDLGKLDEEGLRGEIGKPLKSHGVPEDLLDDVADGGSEVATSKSTMGVKYSLEPGTLLGLSPAQFVQHLREMGIPLMFIKEPSAIADMALNWVRKGFKPW